ncbi:HAD family hydrolase [Candidatus Methylospira mobilis]|nr:HAD family hydrolase [Candidatus Methylospira mobilis]WNV04188.1 HAD family hydrolase [Candidatus Methylospira mobilis]
MSKPFPAIVSFDIDDTLIDFSAMLSGALSAVARQLEARSGQRISVSRLQEARNGVASEIDFADAHFEVIRRESFRRVLAEIGSDGDAGDLWQVWQTYRASNYPLYPDVIPALQWLQSSGMKIVAASNGNTDLRNSSIFPFFDALYYSEALGSRKPAIDFFHGVARGMGVRPAEILHIGDSFREDFQGADAAGMRAVWLNRSRTASVDGTLTIFSLNEIAGVLVD